MATTTRRTFTWRNGIGRTTSRSSPSTPQAADTPAAAHGATAAADGSLAAAAGDSSAAAGNAPGAHGLPERPNVPHGDPPGSPPEDCFGDGDPWQSLRTPPRTPAPLPPPSPAPSASGSKKYVDYKMDPAPVWGGDMPEKNYKEYYRNLQLWLVEAEARLPSNLIGKRIIDSIPLGSKLSSMLAHLSVPEICADNGHKVILKIIEDAHEYLKDQGLERAFDEAIFKGRRERGQSLTTFLSAKKAAFAELKKQGLDLLETRAGRHLLGHLILRQGSFNQDQRQRLKVVTNGSIDYKDIEIAVQKIFGDKLEEPHHHEPGARRWRSATFWDEEAPEDLDDDDYNGQMADADEQEDQLDILEDLIALNENDEVQLVFFEELPMIMEESDALEALGHNLEDVFYETRERLHQKGKGKSKGKKGKGKSSGKTFMAGNGKGGYLQHRKMLQASRTARGYDHPWQHRQGSRLTLTELKSRTRCHQCKQVGHWSKECPQRSKPPASLRSAPASTSSLSGMSTGFFMQPPKEDGSFLVSQTISEEEQYVEQSSEADAWSFLSFVYLATKQSDGTALVDTAAQHGLVGIEVLKSHEKLLQEKFGLLIQWSNESGGSVRGVCGKEERTQVAYVPIGIGGKSGVLRVQVVPGDIPFLLPAYFLTDLHAVIDMKNCMIMYMKLGVKQTMIRLGTGHVAVSIIEFGKLGFHVPMTFAFSCSQAWSFETVPDWSKISISYAGVADPMGPVAALCAAALCLQFPASLAGGYGDIPNTTVALCSTTGPSPRATREGSLATPSRRASSHCPDFVECNTTYKKVFGCERREIEAIGNHSGSWQISGASAGSIHTLHSREDHPWCQSQCELSEMHQLSTRTDDATGPSQGLAPLERDSGLPGTRLPGCQGQGEDCAEELDFIEPSHEFSGGSASLAAERTGKTPRDAANVSNDGPGADSSRERGGVRLHRRHGDGELDLCTLPGLQSVPSGTGDSSPTSANRRAAVEVRSFPMSTVSGSLGGGVAGGRECDPVPTMSDPWHDPDGGGRSQHVPVRVRDVQVEADGSKAPTDLCQRAPDLRCESSSFPDPQVVGKSHHGILNGWLRGKQGTALWQEGNLRQLLKSFDVDVNSTFCASGYGSEVSGKAPVMTQAVVDRRLVLTQPEPGLWSAVNVTTVPGEVYKFGSKVHYVVLYEFNPDFVNYMVEAEFENELTLTKPHKQELLQHIDLAVGEQAAYWTLWQMEEPDDIVEVYGSIPSQKDAIVELYSQPRIAPEAAARGLKAELSIDLATGYDLKQPEDRQKVRDQLRKRKPRLLVTCPPCTKFSPLQNLRAYPERLEDELDEAVLHVDFSMELLEDQRERSWTP